ncbi:hypothetical protein EJ04DRAFT_581940 [Polyplosphaeria fusca]|uniref:Uncharacterized protein n=1 Tax=Polyplosphaeria fusca TaxID=682080 RepID=A0A9P4UT91_9PLEO|nr:hypothetical protein EJ04DRAFT_581940 [Polyplosphaeria fusca]
MSQDHLRILRPKRCAGEPLERPRLAKRHRSPPNMAGPHAPPPATAPEVANSQSLPTIYPGWGSDAVWPSQLAQGDNTMWSLPPHSDQASAIALILRTEIQAHNTTRHMLHVAEQRRLQAAQFCERLQEDARNWSTAYDNIAAALSKCSEAYARLSAENMSFKERLNDPNFRLDPVAPKDKQIRLLRKKLSRQPTADPSGTNDHLCTSPGTFVAPDELEQPYSPDV